MTHEYYMEHREERLVKRREYYHANRERCLAWWREHRTKPEVQAARYAYSQQRYEKKGEEIRAKAREYHRLHPEMRKMRYAKLCERFAQDAEAYAEARRKDRARSEAKAAKEGRMYRPRRDLRIPDWATKGQRIMDTASPWLPENMSPEQKAYARKLAIERKEWRIKNGR